MFPAAVRNFVVSRQNISLAIVGHMLCCTDANKRLISLLPFIETMHGPVSGTPRANNVKDIVKTDSNWLSAFTVVSLDTIATTCLKILISNHMQITK